MTSYMIMIRGQSPTGGPSAEAQAFVKQLQAAGHQVFEAPIELRSVDDVIDTIKAADAVDAAAKAAKAANSGP